MKEIIYDFGGLNLSLFYLINGAFHHEFFYEIVAILSMVYKWSFGVMGILFVMFMYHAKKIFLDNDLDSIFYVIVLSLSFILSFIIISVLKKNFAYERPICSLSKESIHYLVDVIKFEGVFDKCFRSFPSGHSALSVFVSFNLWLITRNKAIRAILVFLPIMTMISRVMTAAHYPADVIYGAAISFLICSVTYKICNMKYKDIKSSGSANAKYS